MELSDAVRKVLRREQGDQRISDAARGRLIGEGRSNVGRWLDGVTDLKLDDAAALARGLGLDFLHVVAEAERLRVQAMPEPERGWTQEDRERFDTVRRQERAAIHPKRSEGGESAQAGG